MMEKESTHGIVRRKHLQLVSQSELPLKALSAGMHCS
uniref:Uncharacterized protein n=1 Tax=Anguilla anguilla TaxID=7936 RepID=A0A0E9RKW9_ANGAN